MDRLHLSEYVEPNQTAIRRNVKYTSAHANGMMRTFTPVRRGVISMHASF